MESSSTISLYTFVGKLGRNDLCVTLEVSSTADDMLLIPFNHLMKDFSHFS